MVVERPGEGRTVLEDDSDAATADPDVRAVSGDARTVTQYTGGVATPEGSVGSGDAPEAEAGPTADKMTARLLGSIGLDPGTDEAVRSREHLKNLDHRSEAEADPDAGLDPAIAEPGGPVQYSGEVDIELAPMADTDDVVKLYSMLQSLETLRILRTSGSSNRGTIITVEVSHPTPLTELLANMSELDARDVAGGRDNSLRSRLGKPG